MKKILLTLVLLVGVVFGLFAQNLTYQAVIRDNNQQLVTNTAVKATVTIDFAGDQTDYNTTITGVSTNIHGLLSFEFGGDALNGRDWTGAKITTTVKSADESVVYVDNLERPVSAVPYALSVNGQSIQNYLTEHNYVDKAELDSRHYLTSDSAVITTMKDNITANVSNITTLQGTLQQLSNQLDVQIAKLDSIAHIVDSLSKLPHGGGGEDKSCPGTPTVTDADGNSYPTVLIGSQCWMAKNLRTSTTIGVRRTLLGEAFYNWNAAMQVTGSTVTSNQGICPDGWHVPSSGEWDVLISYMKTVPDYKCGDGDAPIANALSGGDWNNPSECCPGDKNSATFNKTGFSALPFGMFNADGSLSFSTCAFFASSLRQGNNVMLYKLDPTSNTLVKNMSNFNYSCSVRCLKDN